MRFSNPMLRVHPFKLGGILLGTLLFVSACETQNQEITEQQGALENTTTPEPQAPDVAQPNRVAVELSDFEIAMPEAVPAGPTYFEITNVGETPHNFEIEGQGIEQELDSDLAPNETGTLYVELEPGNYTVYCPVADHEERGMVQELNVLPQ